MLLEEEMNPVNTFLLAWKLLRNRLNNEEKFQEKHLKPCEHVKKGSMAYATLRVERRILKCGKYVTTGYTDKKMCLSCCNILT
jgi:hypothetical protein